MRRCILGKGRERELEEEKEAKAIAGKVFDKIFQRIDMSLFCSSDTMLEFRFTQSIDSSSQHNIVELCY